MLFRNIREYHNHIITVVANSHLTTELHKIRLRTTGKYSGFIYTPKNHDLVLSDDAKMQILEEIVIENGIVHRPKYSHQYRHGDYYFRYDKDSIAEHYPDHAPCHLHAREEEPRYITITHETNLEEFIAFIKASFYN